MNVMPGFFKKKILLISGWALLVILSAIPATAREQVVNLLLTSNLNGRFAVSARDQETQDPMLLMAQSLIHEHKTHPADLYLDLGNAFYPGLLSRFSYGSIMMDFLDYFDCTATLVSSMDLNIGVSNLEFLAKGKNTKLLSANIRKHGEPVFLPYFIHLLNGKKYAFIGISSDKGFVDIAEKKLLDITLKDYYRVLSDVITGLESEKTDYIILLSGRSYSDNFTIMRKFKQISLCISGGDATGELYAVKAERVDIGHGRSLVTMTNRKGFYSLSLSPGERLAVKELKFIPPGKYPVQDTSYRKFLTRLTIWKEKFAQEGDVEITKDIDCDVDVDDARVAQLLRHRFRTEIAILEKNSINSCNISGRIAYSDILRMVNNEFPIFTYRISGSDLKKVIGKKRNFVVAGTDGVSVQGYPIEDKRQYLICSPQSVYDRLAKRFNKDFSYTNSWETISDVIKKDLKGKRVISYGDYGYLDNRFRTLVDVSLSNFFEHASVSRNEDMNIPPGKPAETYEKWGLEDKIDVILYNRFHKFMFTPYIFYIRQNDDYFQNLLRGTFLYTYNLHPNLKPYHKSQVDTVVKEVDDQRPFLFRETFGAFFEMDHITGKVGLGFEKQAQDPEKPLFSGIETIITAKYDFLEYLSYSLAVDNFLSMEQTDFDKYQIRTEITNALSFKLNSFMAFSTKHKWFYFYTKEKNEKYRNSQILLSLDLVTDFKMF
ncbi:MAG: hypothetical protein R6X10_04640 [Desulfobacterales bacterium]